MRNGSFSQLNQQTQWILLGGAALIALTCVACVFVLGIYAITRNGDEEPQQSVPIGRSTLPIATQPIITQPAIVTATFPPTATRTTPVFNPPPVQPSLTFPPNVASAYSTASVLNVRSGPGTGFSVVTQVAPTQVLTLLGRNSDASWVQVRLPTGITGWVSSSFIRANVNLLTLAVTGVPTPTPSPTQSGQPRITANPTGVTVNTQVTVSGSGFPAFTRVNLRLGPNASQIFPTVYVVANTDGNGAFSTAFAMPAQWNTPPQAIPQGQIAVQVATDSFNAVAFALLNYTVLYNPQIAINPQSGGAGTPVAIFGTGFPATTTISIRLGIPNSGFTTGPYVTAATSSGGDFNASLTMPAQWPNGAPITEPVIVVIATADSFSLSANALFNYGSTAPRLIISPTSGGAGTTVSATGSGFPASTRVVIRIGLTATGPVDPPLNETATNAAGAFTINFELPPTWPNTGNPITEPSILVYATAGSVTVSAPLTYIR